MKSVNRMRIIEGKVGERKKENGRGETRRKERRIRENGTKETKGIREGRRK